MTDELKKYFRPEFLNRIDETVVFHALDAINIASIARIQLQVLIERLQKMDLSMEVSEAAIGFQQVAELILVSGISFVGPIPAEVQSTKFLAFKPAQT